MQAAQGRLQSQRGHGILIYASSQKQEQLEIVFEGGISGQRVLQKLVLAFCLRHSPEKEQRAKNGLGQGRSASEKMRGHSRWLQVAFEGVANRTRITPETFHAHIEFAVEAAGEHNDRAVTKVPKS